MKYILVRKCGRCPANSSPLCLADMDLDDKVTDEGFPEGCPLPDFPPPLSVGVSGDLATENRAPDTGGAVYYSPQQPLPVKGEAPTLPNGNVR